MMLIVDVWQAAVVVEQYAYWRNPLRPRRTVPTVVCAFLSAEFVHVTWLWEVCALLRAPGCASRANGLVAVVPS
jgi:hypothetical protein